MRANASWSLAGSLATAGSQWALLVLIAHLASPREVGTFGLATAFIAPAFMLANLQLRGIQATDAKCRFSFSTFWSIRVSTSTVALVALLIFAFLRKNDGTNLHIAILALSIARLIESLSEIVHGRLQKVERLDFAARSNIARSVLSLSVFAAIFFVSSNFLLSLFGLAIGRLITLALFDLRALAITGVSLRALVPEWGAVRRELPELLRSAGPLGITMMLVSLSSNIPRYLLEAETTREHVGIFTAAYHLVSAGTFLVSALGVSSSSKLSVLAKEGRTAEFMSLLGKVSIPIVLASAIGIGLSTVFGRELLTLLYGAGYESGATALTTLSIAGTVGFMASLAGYGLTAAGVHGLQLPVAGVTSLVCLLSSIALVPKLGMVGGALAIGLAHFVNLCLSWLLLSRRLGRTYGAVHE